MRLTRTQLITGSLVLPLALVLGACGSDDDDNDKDKASEQTTHSEAADGTHGTGATSGTQAADEVDAIQAIDAAEAEAGGYTVELERSTEDGRPVWEVKVVTADGGAREVDIDRNTGEVVKTESADVDDDERNAPAITAQRAVEIAVGTVPGTVVDLNLDEDDGVLLWEADVRADGGGETEVTIDATSGDVRKTERD